MYKKIRNTAMTLGLLAGPTFSQDTPPQQTAPPAAQAPATDGGWHRMGPSPSAAAAKPADQPMADPQVILPSRITVKAGTYVTVRLNEVLSSDHSTVGDAFTATLTKPVVVDGIVIAQRGQNVTGRVTEAKKAGRVAGTSRLGIQLIELPAVDGQQLPLQSELLTRNGTTSTGRDAGAVATTTGVGAAIGAGVNGGVGAGVGAGAGLVVGLAGVLLTRGNPTFIYPETTLTFRVNQDISVSTEHGAQAFRYVVPSDYETAAPVLARRAVRPAYGYGYGYGYPYYPYPYWGGFYYGGRFGYRRW